ncbi:helix-turn-helix transcriptional regulator [Saccharothrix violaceirubra]|uniref:helix-turn-helix domain-containing protein n=1 Tax=Saccharothrix violaceirubra TaxID=413306 RepID=UPI0031EBCEDE
MVNRPPFRRRRLGKKLARMRNDSRLTLDAAAKALDMSRSSLHRTEKGETRVSVHLVKSMMDLYDVYDPELIEQVRRARENGWWTMYGIGDQGYIDVETEACAVHDMSLLLIPGLLQTEDYMRAVFEAHSVGQSRSLIENDVRVRKIRQRRLYDADDPLRLVALLDESALRKMVGGESVMREQLAHLHEAARLPNVEIKVLADGQGAHFGMMGSFTLLEFSEAEELPVLYIEHRFGAIHIEEGPQLDEARLTFEHLAAQAVRIEEFE